MEPQSVLSAISAKDFESKILTSEKLVAVEFGAGWCGSCHMLGPILDDLAHEYEKKLCICRVDVDDSPTLKEKFGISALPTILFFKNGEIVDHIVGAIPRKPLRVRLENLLNKEEKHLNT